MKKTWSKQSHDTVPFKVNLKATVQPHRWQICRWCRCYLSGIFDTGGKFAAGINDTDGKFATCVNNTRGTGGKFDASVVDTGSNGPNVIFRGLGEGDSWKKPEAKNLVTLSL